MTRGAELRTTTRDGKRFRTTHLDVRVAVTSTGLCRVGLVVPKHGQTAVGRNQLKRRLRELTRLEILGALRTKAARAGMDIVLRALPGAYRASYEELRADVDTLVGRMTRLAAVDSGDQRTAGAPSPSPRQ